MANINNRRSLLQRHRWKLLISLFSVTALCATGSIVMFLVKRWLYRQQLRISEDHFIREQMRRRFIQTQEDSLRTLCQLIPVFAIVLNKDELNIDELFNELKNKKRVTEESTNEENIEKSKAELWNELKSNSIVKIITITYTVSTFFLLTRLQLNMLARREYLESAVNMNVEKKKNDSKGQYSIMVLISRFWNNSNNQDNIINSTNENTITSSTGYSMESNNNSNKIAYINEQGYLSLSWWLLNNGYKTFKRLAHKYVAKEFETINPRDQLTLEEFSNHLSNVFQAINKDILISKEDSINIRDVILPSDNDLFTVLQQTLDQNELELLQEDDTVLRRLMHELTQCVQSSASNIVLENLVNESYQYIMNHIEEKVIAKNQKTSNVSAESSFQMALFAIVSKDTCRDMLADNTSNNSSDASNEYLQCLDRLEALDDLSSSVYSNFNV
ncbi:similar to Saccharomyces cerevisiae YDR329C PEX3 Peroxisomal membrane protein (PMP) required for proper localization and stability of PMPs [Maudiozyma barnettii]|uniref:Peroxin-3 n=1 Tax=Maudiozyma barnettii TaxID=61262 RepID=A0A8H2ZGL7_9SACH|nr:Pex3p [Kazachstania barnettii]CAB4253793.1 similar to Saccharomyces cerevisiae YDR329C PEX3 Peroxisomal membrane protein (PMP) required for proper localization and stability of PMPs [Kazachstania barnettii]CAD1781542.1 similar to Saccharomyces cerevisiae YDR329C PEX3 Peroxisomal membrane protein (PMP) required for proper localization and stability of PMPs [Kazachstania barnettii]